MTGRRNSQEFKKKTLINKKQLMRKVMRSIIYGMIKKFKMKSYLKGKECKLNATPLLIVEKLKLIFPLINSHIFASILPMEIVSWEKSVFIIITFLRQRSVCWWTILKIYLDELDLRLIEKTKWEQEITCKRVEHSKLKIFVFQLKKRILYWLVMS